MGQNMSFLSPKKLDPDSSYGSLMWISSLGIHLVVAAVVGFFIGNIIDGKTHTSPVFTVIFFVLGIVAGFREIFRQAKILGESGKPADDEKKRNNL